MVMPTYLTIEQMLEKVDEPNRSACVKILSDNRTLFQTVQGSTHNHHAWVGGYFDHVQEIMSIAVILYERLNLIRSLPFSLSDVLLVTFLHDIEKPWKYEIGSDDELQYIPSMQTKKNHHEFRSRKLQEYGIVLTSDQKNGMKYVEGELDDYTNRRRVMGSLAAFCHLCDVTSARIWFDSPMEHNDPWQGAKRIRD